MAIHILLSMLDILGILSGICITTCYKHTYTCYTIMNIARSIDSVNCMIIEGL